MAEHQTKYWLKLNNVKWCWNKEKHDMPVSAPDTWDMSVCPECNNTNFKVYHSDSYETTILCDICNWCFIVHSG